MQTPSVSHNTQHLLRIAHSGLRVAYYVLRYVSPLCIILLGLAIPANAQDDVTFTASVDRSTITTDDLLTLQLTLSGAFNMVNQPQLPVMESFAVVGSSQSSQLSIVNGKTSSKVVFTYRLQPIETGSLIIPAIPINMGGQTYRTEPIAVEVTQGNAPQAQQPTEEAPADTSAPSELSGQNLHVEAEVDNPTPVVGQQIVYHFRLYQAVNLLSQPQLSWPDFTGFLGYELSPNTQYYQQAAGKQYLVTEVRRALFPTAEGQVTIGPATLTVPGDFFNHGVQLQTQEVTVNVHPLPEEPPEDFSGAVGQFEIEAWIEPAEGRVNEPVTLFVRVFGAGNVSTLPDPTQGVEETLLGWRVYDPQVTTDVSQDGDVIQGEKLFERPLVPKTDGDLTIPPLALSYYDPEAGTYHRVETEPLAVRVAPGEVQTPGPVFVGTGKQDVVVLASDIRHIKPAPPALVTNHTSLLEQPLYWLGWGMPFLTVVGTWLWDRRRQHLAHNIAYARAQRARRHARQRLSEARKLVRTGKSEDENAAYATVAHAVTSYVGDKLDLSAAGLMRDSIQQALSTSSVPTEVIDRVLACLDWADSGRFAPVAAGRKADDLIQEAEEIIIQLEESIT